jgi:hypothetical protein
MWSFLTELNFHLYLHKFIYLQVKFTLEQAQKPGGGGGDP